MIAASSVEGAALTGTTNAPPGAAPTQPEAQDSRKNYNYPLVRFSDMNEELRAETVDMVVTAVEKHPGNYEAAAKNIKEAMDKKCGNAWHAVIGEGFDFEITYEMGNIIFMYVGIMGILVWKAL